MTRPFSRRTFLRGTTAVVAGALAAPYILRAAPAEKQKLRLAFIGVGGQGGAHVGLAKDGLCVAYADVDPRQYTKIAKLAPDAKAYTDWRKMLDAHENEIDAVIIAIPDHSHACAALRAIKAGKHCYCEKPLTWSIAEARALAAATAEKKVATQMGNQGHANEYNRLTVEYVRAGIIGDIKEIHTWTTRPSWPQGIAERPPVQLVPDGVNWDAWIGPAPFRDYHDGLHRFKWRAWFDFGCGAVGDMGCHTWDGPYWAMAPDYPDSVELLEVEGKSAETFPKKTHFKWNFPARGERPAFEAHWYSGGFKPTPPDEFLNDPAFASRDGTKPALRGSGSLYIGTKGKFFCTGDYGGAPTLIPTARRKEVKAPDKTLARSPGHKQEWLAACRGEKPWDYPGANFTYSGPLTEVLLLGAMVERMGEKGARIECAAVTREIKTAAAREWIGREPRKGWGV